ncbi:hypothetical protein LZZ90_00245 [Flavobacterium sp. SM15]|uniref:hypothetical protein n=1 Tax=Flavobacterium sp. SM15 TaxID=2908005 RepID=UPI001EDBEFA2|nr:hypothetical protein [Flavobacterium sp. SM15]MCG2609931.1 hypothetical protein [Flavobacterium sp. SM15]
MQNLFAIVFFLMTSLGFSQEKQLDLKFIGTEKIKPDTFVGKDAYANTYSITQNEFRKENPQKKYVYRSLPLGKIHSVDLQNPLQIVLFYKIMNSVVLLDSQLNETFKINFSESNPELLPQQIGLASQNRLWLFDLATQKLGLYDFQKQVFNPITVIFEHPILFSQSDYNYFYWVDDQHKLFACNLFGKINFLGEVPNFDSMQIISSKEILLKKGSILTLWDWEKQTSQIVPIPEKSFQSFYYKEQILSIFTDNEIRNYKLILP